MKRRAFAFLCAVLLAAQLAGVPARAASTVYFTAVNETILELSDATMPFWSGGYLFVSSNLFSNKELGLYYSYNTAKKIAVVYTNIHALIFNLNDDTVIDGQSNGYYPPAILKNSNVFLPVSLVASFFGLTYTSKKVEHGYLIRVRSDSSVLSDSAFLDAGGSVLASRYSQYLKAAEGTPGGTAGSGTGQTTVPEVGNQQIYLCFRAGDDAQRTGQLLDTLDAAGAFATVYLTVRQIRDDGDLARRLTATGHAVGLVADAAAGAVTEQLRAANAALCQATGEKTRLCFVQNGKEADLAAASGAGYCCLVPDLDRSAYGLRSVSNANYLLSRIGARRGAVSVWLDAQLTVSGLRSFLSSAAAAGDILRRMTETT